MGLIWSRFSDKPSTRDTLERIEQELQNIEERRWDQIRREQYVQILSFLPIIILIANVCILIYPSDSTWRDKLLLSVPIVLLNLTLWLCKKITQWYSKWSLDNEASRLRKLQKEKKRILDMVCETESYRVATELLEKYDPKQLRRQAKTADRPPAQNLNSTIARMSASPIRSKQPMNSALKSQPVSPVQFHNQSFNLSSVAPQLPVPAPPPPTPVSKPVPQSAIKSQLNTTSSLTTTIAASSVQGRPVRPIISKDRSIIEKVIDWVVADGPDNRFALICRFCYGHNGMCLAEEFETINFRCCYCYNLNIAISKRPQSAVPPEKGKEATESKETPDSEVAQESRETKNAEETKNDEETEKNEETENIGEIVKKAQS